MVAQRTTAFRTVLCLASCIIVFLLLTYDIIAQIKQGAPVSDEILKTFVEDKYFRFLSKPRDAASWDRLEAIVRENASGSAAEVNELEQCGITVRSVPMFTFRPSRFL
jgi:hypothetical protein